MWRHCEECWILHGSPRPQGSKSLSCSPAARSPMVPAIRQSALRHTNRDAEQRPGQKAKRGPGCGRTDLRVCQSAGCRFFPRLIAPLATPSALPHPRRWVKGARYERGSNPRHSASQRRLYTCRSPHLFVPIGNPLENDLIIYPFLH